MNGGPIHRNNPRYSYSGRNYKAGRVRLAEDDTLVSEKSKEKFQSIFWAENSTEFLIQGGQTRKCLRQGNAGGGTAGTSTILDQNISLHESSHYTYKKTKEKRGKGCGQAQKTTVSNKNEKKEPNAKHIYIQMIPGQSESSIQRAKLAGWQNFQMRGDYGGT